MQENLNRRMSYEPAPDVLMVEEALRQEESFYKDNSYSFRDGLPIQMLQKDGMERTESEIWNAMAGNLMNNNSMDQSYDVDDN